MQIKEAFTQATQIIKPENHSKKKNNYHTTQVQKFGITDFGDKGKYSELSSQQKKKSTNSYRDKARNTYHSNSEINIRETMKDHQI